MNMKETNKNNLINNDKGSTLITVIVAIGFVTILVAIILSTTLMNLRMKGVDRRAKDNFYYAEKALNDIYTEIGQAVQNQAADAYEIAFISVGKTIKENLGELNDDGTQKGEVTYDFKTAEKAQEYYKKKFISNMSTWLNGIVKDDTTKESSQLEGYIVDTGRAYKVTVGNAVNEYFDETNTKICGVRLKDVVVTATDDTLGEQAIVATDIVIYIPNLNFLGPNADVSEYSIIANNGLVADGKLTIDGNLYVGTNSVDESTSGIHINKGETVLNCDRVVSKGDILVGNGNDTEDTPAKLTVGNDKHTTDLWVDSIKTVKGSTISSGTDYAIKIDATTFALNDLELNCNNSKVIVSGNYYGYDDGRLVETDSVASLYDVGKNHSDSSAVIINGNEADLSMLDVNSFVLMGKAYIEPNGTDEIATAEGVALRTNQQLYLVPTDFLECSNPTSDLTAFMKNNDKYTISTIPDDWFGAKYLKVNSTTAGKNIYAVDVVNKSGAYYAFFEFNDDMFFAELEDDIETKTIVRKHDVYKKDDESGELILDKTQSYDERKSDKKYSAGFSARTGYIKEVMAGEEKRKEDGTLDEANPTAKRLKKRINLSISNTAGKAFNLSKCVILDDGTSGKDYTKKNVYANNAVVSYYPMETPDDGERFTIKAIFNTAAKNRYSNYPQNLFWRFKWLCANLDGNDSIPLYGSIDSKPDANVEDEKFKMPGKDAFSWVVDSEYPFITLIGLSTDASNSDGTKSPSNQDFLDNTKNSQNHKNAEWGEFAHIGANGILDHNVNGFVLCDGNLEVERGVNVRGTILAKGSITFDGDNSVTSDTAIIQKMINNELSSVREHEGYYRSDYLISYLIDENGALKYKVLLEDDGYKAMKSELASFNYNDYMHFDNWQKGGRY